MKLEQCWCNNPDYPDLYNVTMFIRLKDVKRVMFIEGGKTALIECYGYDSKHPQIHTQDLKATMEIAEYLLSETYQTGTVN